MSIKSERLIQQKFNIVYEKNVDDITNVIKNSVGIPFLPQFAKYIKYSLNLYNAVLLILKLEEQKVGSVLLFTNPERNNGILYFGFFSVTNHNEDYGNLLVDNMKIFAKNRGASIIRGPINIPTTIYGWGFMKEGSKNNNFIGCPNQPDIYNQIFQKKDFNIRFEENRYRVVISKFDPLDPENIFTAKYCFDDYEYHNPDSIADVMDVKDEIINLHESHMPPSAQITPSEDFLFLETMNFIFEFGDKSMIFWLTHKPTNKIVSAGHTIPNPFSKGKRGLKEISMHDWVVDPDHRRKGLTKLIYGITSLRIPESIKRGSFPVGADNIPNTKNVENLGGRKNRTHYIYEFHVKENIDKSKTRFIRI